MGTFAVEHWEPTTPCVVTWGCLRISYEFTRLGSVYDFVVYVINPSYTLKTVVRNKRLIRM